MVDLDCLMHEWRGLAPIFHIDYLRPHDKCEYALERVLDGKKKSIVGGFITSLFTNSIAFHFFFLLYKASFIR